MWLKNGCFGNNAMRIAHRVIFCSTMGIMAILLYKAQTVFIYQLHC